MALPTDVGVIDLMIAPPFRDAKRTYTFLRQNLRDKESLEEFEFPAQYMFKNVPHPEPDEDPVGFLLDQMDKFGIEKGMLGVSFHEERSADSLRAVREYPDRFFGSFEVDPNRGMDGVRDLVRACRRAGRESGHCVSRGPAIRRCRSTTRSSIPIYAKCIELDIPICVVRGRARAAGAVRTAVRRV